MLHLFANPFTEHMCFPNEVPFGRKCAGHNTSCFLTARGKSQWTWTWYNDTTVQCPLRFVVPTIVTTLSFTYHYSNNLVCRNVNHSDLSNTGIFGISSDNFNFTHPNLPYQFDLEKGTHFGRWKTTWNKGSENMSFRVFFGWRRTFFASTRWSPTSYEWHYSPCKWPYKWFFLGLKYPLITLVWAGLAAHVRFHHWKHPLCPRSNLIIKEDMEKYNAAWASQRGETHEIRGANKKSLFEGRWIRGDVFVEKLLPKNSLNGLANP